MNKSVEDLNIAETRVFNFVKNLRKFDPISFTTQEGVDVVGFFVSYYHRRESGELMVKVSINKNGMQVYDDFRADDFNTPEYLPIKKV